MYTVVVFETDEAAEHATVELGVEEGALEDCGNIGLLIGGHLHLEFAVEDDMWVLRSNMDQCTSIKTLRRHYPESRFVDNLAMAQRLLTNQETFARE